MLYLQCGKNLKKAMESLQKHISKVQYIQIREGQRSQLTLLKRPLNSIDKATPAVTPNNFMKLEFGLRDLVSGMRKLVRIDNAKLTEQDILIVRKQYLEGHLKLKWVL